MKKTSVLLSVLVAAGAGLIVGVLLAPNSGARTRRKILHLGEDIFEDLQQTVEDSFEDFKRETQDKFDEFRNKLVCNPELHLIQKGSKDQTSKANYPES
ncbi:hypothetical protein DYBT9275_05864 [Dyadobacter sp. CECT 9275]|uniref:YtxH domain-containing protein n=1 Tax=Dyadobacter helix TaxID=2822344 RepID=A0A916JIK8_9BACT|nr:YtxH domain-containing protein [Dyadobacter sp. CECT 9275]CAG5017873.1 hypothetical protein DYBT9275_05864 [Dyadobacter sp. CECT 9275]